MNITSPVLVSHTLRREREGERERERKENKTKRERERKENREGEGEREAILKKTAHAIIIELHHTIIYVHCI